MEGKRNYFNSKEIYPETGIYRETQEEIEKYGDALYTSFFSKPTNLHRLNGETGTTPLELTEEEGTDVRNYVRFAAKRLAAASITSPMSETEAEDLILEKGSEYAGTVKHPAFNMSPSDSVAHDLVHTMAAYAESHGKSLLPRYTRVANVDEQETDLQANEEEMIAELWGTSNGNFLKILIESGDAVDAYRKKSGVEMKPEERSAYENLVKEIEPLKESDPLEYSMKAFEKYFILEQKIFAGPNAKAKVPGIIEQITDNRSEAYTRIFTTLYNGLTAEHQDSKLYLHTFLSEVNPLLERLRNESETE